ncbi:MAG: hypothetical protein ACI9KE_003450 [Polyangiales bacterium]|jgi:hypothetical protein
MTLLLGYARLSASACFFLLGCSTATTLSLRDGTMVRGAVAPGSDDASVRVLQSRGPIEIPVADVVDVSHPGSGRIVAGGLLAFLGVVGQVTIGAIAGESSSAEPDYVDPMTGRAYYEDGGCEFCVIGLPATVTPLAFGTGLLLHGIALRMESHNQWHDGAAIGTAHLRLGGAALAAGLVFSALAPMVFSDQPAIAGTGFALIGFAPGFALSGIALLIRGGSLRRGRRPAVELTARGFTFDLSL